MNTQRISSLAALAAAAIFATSAAHAGGIYLTAADARPAASASADAVSQATQAAVIKAVGDSSPDLQVTVRNGAARLVGWARDEADVAKATAAAQRVDGVQRVYANSVRVWSTDEAL